MSNCTPAPPANDPTASPDDERVAEALRLMREALKVIDENDGPADAGAHLDDAINRMEAWLSSERGQTD